MGILGLFKLLKSKFPNSAIAVPIQSLKQKTLAIDTSGIVSQSFLNQMMNRSGMKTPKDADGHKTAHLITIINRALICKKYGIKAIWVFDGEFPLEKFKQQVNRSSYKKKVFAKIDDALDAGDIEKAYAYRKRTKKISAQELDNATNLIKLLGFQVMIAPAEAISQCAFLSKNGIVDSVVTDDLNALALGSKFIIKDFKQKKTVQKICLSSIYQQSRLSEQQFVDFCILLGCNYTGIISGMGAITSLKLILKQGSIENIIKYITKLKSKKYKLTQQFNFQRARQLFKYPNVAQIQYQIKNQPMDLQNLQIFLQELQFPEKRISSWMKKLEKYQ